MFANVSKEANLNEQKKEIKSVTRKGSFVRIMAPNPPQQESVRSVHEEKVLPQAPNQAAHAVGVRCHVLGIVPHETQVSKDAAGGDGVV